MLLSNETLNSTFFAPLIASTSSANQSNRTNPLPTENVGLKYTIYLFYGMIFISGFLGNILVVVTIVGSDKTKSLKHCFLLNLAVTDLLTLLFVLPLVIIGRHLSWPFGEFVCKYIFPLTDVVIAVSVLTHVSISLDRYRTIIYPMAAKPSHIQRILILIAIWVFSYLLNGLPLSLVLQIGEGLWVKVACNPVWPSIPVARGYFLQRLFVIFVVPIMVNLLSYVRISKALKASLLLLQGSARGKKRETRIRSQQRLIRMFRAIFIAFVVCSFPIHLVTMLQIFLTSFPNWSGSGDTFQVAIVFCYANSMCNPVILVVMSTDYRKTFYSYVPSFHFCSCHAFLKGDHARRFKSSEEANHSLHSPVTTHVDLIPSAKLLFSNANGGSKDESAADYEKNECYELNDNIPKQIHFQEPSEKEHLV